MPTPDSRAEFRVMGPTGMEDYYAHLLRLDAAHRLPTMAPNAVSAHCLSLQSGGAIVVGAYVDGVMRAAAEIVPDRTAKRAEAAITVESGYEDREFARMLMERAVDEARRYNLSMLRVIEQHLIRDICVADGRHQANG